MSLRTQSTYLPLGLLVFVFHYYLYLFIRHETEASVIEETEASVLGTLGLSYEASYFVYFGLLA